MNHSGIQEDSLVPVVIEMNVLDAVFVRREHRGRGWGSAVLRDITEHFERNEDENLGFSHPISLSLQHGIIILIIWLQIELIN